MSETPSDRPGGIRRAPISGSVEPRPPRLARSDEDASLHGPSPDDLRKLSGRSQTCPHCKKAVYDDTDVCYHCGLAIEAKRGDAPKPWVVVVIVLIVVAFVYSSMRGAF